MTLKADTKVLISGQPGIENKWPTFCASFLSKTGIINKIHPNEVLVQIRLDDKSFIMPIWAQRDWVTAI